jgi:hypothetical protein
MKCQASFPRGARLSVRPMNLGTADGVHLGLESLTMISRLMLVALCVLGPLTCFAHGGNINGEASYISFSVPGAFGTYPMSINASMEVIGYYYVSPTMTCGFLREADGTITTFDVPGAVWTEPEGINAAGNITGFYELTAGVPQGFVRYADGRIVTFDPSPAQPGMPLEAQPISINDFDEIAGNYPFPLVASSVFTRSSGGTFNTIRAPLGADYPTVVTAMNASGAVLGYSWDGEDNEPTGFLEHPDGYWEQIAIVPVEMNQKLCVAQTFPDAINAGGTIAGWYLNYTNSCYTKNIGGFVMSADGVFTLFQPPGTLVMSPTPGFAVDGGSLTVPHWISIDQSGDITGSYTDAAGVQHGFVRNPYGTISTFDPPEGKQTTATSINDAGAIAGFYQYNAGGGPAVAFIRVP